MTESFGSADSAEQVVAQFGTLFVTDSRVREQSKDGLKSAYLHEVNAVGTQRTHHPWLLALAVVGVVMAFLGGVAGPRDPAPLIGGGVLVAIVFGLGYLLTRQVTLAVVAGQMTLSTTLAGANTPLGGGAKAGAAAEDFIESVEAAKHAWETRRRVA